MKSRIGSTITKIIKFVSIYQWSQINVKIFLGLAEIAGYFRIGNMDKKKEMDKKGRPYRPSPIPERASHGRMVSITNKIRCLDPLQLSRLEKSFRDWVDSKSRSDLQLARKRILLIFLLIRYTGAKLNEVLTINPLRDIDLHRHLIVFEKLGAPPDRPPREIQISGALSSEIRSLLDDPVFKKSPEKIFRVDPGHVRRKFYERAAACGFPKSLGAPDVIRKSRAVELMQSNMPLPVVQKIMGHSTPNLTSSLVSFSEEDIRQAARFFFERESFRKTSARNAFFGKIRAIQTGDIQAKVELVTIGGGLVTTVITNESLARLGFKKGTLLTAEIKAPQVILEKTDKEPQCTAENRFQGNIARINRGRITTEYVVRIADGTELCSLVSSEINRRLDLKENDPVWVIFNSFSVVLHAD
jgi:molybdate transport system regulatory protein